MMINNEEWALQFISPTDPLLEVDDGFTLGVTIPEHHTIYLSDDLYGEKLHRVLCHELAHAEFISRGLILPTYVEECLADIISDNIIDVANIADCIHYNLCDLYGRC